MLYTAIHTSVFNIVDIIIIIILLLSLLIIVYVLRKTKKYLKRYEKLISLYKVKSVKLYNTISEEKSRVELHKEELLTQSENLQELNVELERLSLVASKTDTAVAIADYKGRFTYVNKGFTNLFGYTLPELIKFVGSDVYSASNRMNIVPVLKQALEQKKPIQHTSTITTRGGAEKWIKTTLNPIFNELGNVSQFIMLHTDVSELKLVNDNLKKLSLVASKTDSSVIIFNSKGNIDWVNDSFTKMHGYTLDEFIEEVGVSIMDFCKEEKKSEKIEQLLLEKKPVSFISAFTDRDGNNKWKQSTVTPIYDKEGEIKNFIIVESDISKIKEAEQHLKVEKDKADQLLLNILPEETAEELKTKGKATPRFYRSVSVLFADIINFTKLAENLTPEELVNDLQTYFSQFDDVATKHIVEKIKTIGDAYMCVGGLPMRNKSHAFDTVLVGLELQHIIKKIGKERKERGKQALQLRIGIHSGPVVAGVVGKQKMTYDIWGDTVNIAKRIESACVSGMVNISYTTYEIVKAYFECEHRGEILAKHKGHVDMYFVHKLKPEFAEDKDGIIPNVYFREMLAQL